jgi:hypothetical protein
MDVEDVTNITGVGALLNYDGQQDVTALEKNIINELQEQKIEEIDDIEVYQKQMEKLGEALGVDMDESNENSPAEQRWGNGDVAESSVFPEVEEYSDSNPNKNFDSDEIDNMYKNVDGVPLYKPKPGSFGAQITEEQKKQKILNHVLAGVEDQTFSVEKEKEEDDKAIMLEQIDMLITNLSDEGIDVTRIPEVNSHSSLTEISSVHKILRLKNDRNRYCSFAEECILATAHTLEWMFDGEKSYMGRRPDLRGWSATVNIKLRRMKYETSTFVSGVMQDYDLGPGTRIALELVPSLFLYSKMRKSQYSDNLLTSDEMSDALGKIRCIMTDCTVLK